MPVIKIKAQATHNGHTLLLLGLVSLLLIAVFGLPFWRQANYVLMLLILVSLVLTFLGVTKIMEPNASFTLKPQYIRYQHKYGYWQLTWPELAHIAEVNESIGLDRINLPYVGVRLTQLNGIANNISPRLASRLIHEHRPLMSFCLQQRLLTFEQSIMNFTPFKLDGEIITGPKAAFLHQTMMLKKALGFHLFLPQSALDRQCDEFAQLLKQCQQNSADYLVNEQKNT